MNCTQCQETLFDYLEDLLDNHSRQALEEHIQTCKSCQDTLASMQAVETRLIQHAQHTAQADLETRVLGAIVRTQKQQLNTNTPPLRRSIMKSPFFKFAIAAVVIVACVLGFSLFNSTQNIALADVLTKIEQVRAFMYQMNMAVTTSGDLSPGGQPRTQNVTATVLMSQDYGTKFSMNTDAINQSVLQEQYIQPQNNRMLMIMPEQKRYLEMELNDQLITQYKEQSRDPRYMIEQIMNCDYEKIGKSEINGIQVEGFHTSDPAYTGGTLGNVDVTLWVDSKTWLPIQIDMDIAMEGDMAISMQGMIGEFQWDVPVDASVFNPVIPEDYTSIGTGSIKMPEMTEDSAIEGLRSYAELTEEYPEGMGMTAIMGSIKSLQDSNTPAAIAFKQSLKDQDEEAMTQAMLNAIMPIQAAAGFYARLVQQGKEPAYYGDIVTPDQPDLILMRWRIDDNQYKVIFSDLTTLLVDAQGLAALESALPEKRIE